MGLSLGFVAICLSEHNCSPAATVQLKSVAQLPEAAVRSRIERTALKNLANTLRIMYFLPSHGFRLYRFSSGLIPLATHPIIDGWEWWEEPKLRAEMEKIGRVATGSGIRLSMHAPSQVVLNAESAQTFAWTKRYLDYMDHLFAAMNLDATAKIVFHIGGFYGSKAKALDLLRRNVEHLAEHQRSRIVLENDDTHFSAEDVLAVAGELGFPAVLDLHHHLCVPSRTPLDELIAGAISTWHDRPPKFHASSPKNPADFRAHADYVDVHVLEPLLAFADAPQGLDVMVEAKKKDLAALQLQKELAIAATKPAMLRVSP